MKAKKTLYEACKAIVEHKQHAKFQGQRIDLFSASAYVKVYEALNEENKEKLASRSTVSAFYIVFKMVGFQIK